MRGGLLPSADATAILLESSMHVCPTKATTARKGKGLQPPAPPLVCSPMDTMFNNGLYVESRMSDVKKTWPSDQTFTNQ